MPNVGNAFPDKINHPTGGREIHQTYSSLPVSLLGRTALTGPVCHHSSAPGSGSAILSPNSSHPAKVQGILSPCTQFTQLVLPGHWGLVFVYCTFPRSKALHWPQPLLTPPTSTCLFLTAILI